MNLPLGRNSLVSIELIHHFSLVELRERKRTHLLHKDYHCSFGWWLVLICSEKKVLLAGFFREVVLADKPNERGGFLVLWKVCWFLKLGWPRP
jgi:hypothetical protein